MSYFTKQRRNYEYDSMNQLVRENLYYGENNSANSTYTYAYDSYGNMLGKNRYAYTTCSIANKLGIIVAEYQYTDSQWGDLLTAVTDGTVSTGSKQNNTVSYDEMGNPTRYFGAAMTWAGKQLKYWGKSGKYVNFAYNEDGIRTLKNSNGVVTNYYYNGSLLIGMTVGSAAAQEFSASATILPAALLRWIIQPITARPLTPIIISAMPRAISSNSLTTAEQLL